MINSGIWSDTLAVDKCLTSISIGHRHIKQQRATRGVPVGPGGCVSDYVPFYFAPRSPMLYAISRGSVEGYDEGCDRIVYLATTVAELRGRNLPVIGTDRHALTEYARFTADDHELTGLVDWSLMFSKYWNDTAEYPDRRERRQAELLVHECVPWGSIRFIAARSVEVAAEVEHLVRSHTPKLEVAVRPWWYF